MAASRSLAPPTSFVAGPTALLAMALILLWCAGALVAALVWFWGGLAGPALAWLVALLGVSAMASGWFWRGQQPRLLTWDGGNCLLSRPGVAPDARRDSVQVTVALDLQLALLVRSRAMGARGRCRWLWLQRAGDQRRWHAVRCALFAVQPVA